MEKQNEYDDPELIKNTWNPQENTGTLLKEHFQDTFHHFIQDEQKFLCTELLPEPKNKK